MSGYIVFGRPTCPYCVDACNRLEQNRLPYRFLDVTAPDVHRKMLELCARTERAPAHPATVPQIFRWHPDRGAHEYVGGADSLKARLGEGALP